MAHSERTSFHRVGMYASLQHVLYMHNNIKHTALKAFTWAKRIHLFLIEGINWDSAFTMIRLLI